MSIPSFSIQTETNPRQSVPENFPHLEMGRSMSDHGSKKARGRRIVREFLELLQAGVNRFALLGGFVAEMRSLPHRMKLQYKRRYDLYGVDVGLLHEKASDGLLRWNTRTHACNADIENLVEGRPWATMIDVVLYRDAWVKGAEWGIHSYYNSAQGNLASDTSVSPETAGSAESSAFHTFRIF